MRIVAPMMILILMTSTLAGCVDSVENDILDESQNTTVEQMKMFLTRVGFGSTVVVTGDITQIDLPNKTMSGLRHVLTVLKDINGISFTHFSSRDVVRHPLVQRIVEAYDRSENG